MIIILIVFFVLFLIWSILMLNDSLKELDNNFYNKIIITKNKTKIFKFITFLASAKFISFLCVILILLFNNKKILLAILLNIIIMWILIGILKNIFKRKRPNVKRLVEENGYSYPSGHTMTATIFYGFIIFLVIIANIVFPFKIISIFILFLLIIFIGYSRVYLGVHYLSDVIGAIFFGTSYILLYIFFTHYIFNFI